MILLTCQEDYRLRDKKVSTLALKNYEKLLENSFGLSGLKKKPTLHNRVTMNYYLNDPLIFPL